ncbi:MAG: hypothetical protein CVU71_17915 [Deltaproteobacteria bacterium HGW-Deltaproteobacteria-6]|jgi:hypothetical protein|nr:MAG: hypothetical protein CVU71_17915 [Deltaproteobacteria bacterium HGW-Deltaproteobacteria-6]
MDARIQDRIAEGILQTLIEVGETTAAEPDNYDARSQNRITGRRLPCQGVQKPVPARPDAFYFLVLPARNPGWVYAGIG